MEQHFLSVGYNDTAGNPIYFYWPGVASREYKFFVKLNAVTKGEFNFPGTVLEAMYDYDYRAYKKGEQVIVK